jgi:hypothetical protein
VVIGEGTRAWHRLPDEAVVDGRCRRCRSRARPSRSPPTCSTTCPADLPLTILAVLSAFAGASSIVAGLLLLAGTIDRADLAAPETTAALDLGWWWTVLYLVFAATGIVVQLRDAEARRGSLRGSWAE